MQFTVSQLPQSVLYKLLTATVTPRPIAWVTTRSIEGHINAAPFSFFNIMGSEPPLAVFSVTRPDKKDKKDTIQNILDTGEFVVNLVPYTLADAMSITAMDAPHGVNELECAGLETLPSKSISVPQIALSPVSFECVNHSTILTGKSQYMVIGQVVEIRIDDAFVIDPAKGYIDTEAMGIIGRMGGRGTYTKCTDLFQVNRAVYKKTDT